MAEEKQEIIDVELIPQNQDFSITINTDLYARLQQLVLTGLAYKDKEHFDKCLEELRNNKIEDPIAYHMQTLIHLIAKFEEAARKENVLQKKKFSFTDNKFID